MTADLGTPSRAPAVNPPEEPETNPYFYDDMSYKAAYTLYMQRGYPNRDAGSPFITRLPATDQIDR